MSDWVSRFPPALAAALLGLIVSACAQPAQPRSPELMARCAKLYMLWWNYAQHPTFHHSGQRARAELALHRCENGRYEEGLPELETLLKRDLIAVPPVTPPS